MRNNSTKCFVFKYIYSRGKAFASAFFSMYIVKKITYDGKKRPKNVAVEDI